MVALIDFSVVFVLVAGGAFAVLIALSYDKMRRLWRFAKYPLMAEAAALVGVFISSLLASFNPVVSVSGTIVFALVSLLSFLTFVSDRYETSLSMVQSAKDLVKASELANELRAHGEEFELLVLFLALLPISRLLDKDGDVGRTGRAFLNDIELALREGQELRPSEHQELARRISGLFGRDEGRKRKNLGKGRSQATEFVLTLGRYDKTRDALKKFGPQLPKEVLDLLLEGHSGGD